MVVTAEHKASLTSIPSPTNRKGNCQRNDNSCFTKKGMQITILGYPICPYHRVLYALGQFIG